MKPQETLLYREIHEQPAVLARFLDGARDETAALAAAIRARNVTHVIIAARGTSDNAGRYAQYVLGAHNRLSVGLTTPSLFSIYNRPPSLNGALVLGISQSGQSPDIVAVLAEGRRQGALTAVITNNPRSPLAAEADHCIDLRAGVEQAVAATKSYTAQLAAIALLSATLSGDEAHMAQLHRLPTAVSLTLTIDDAIAAIAPRYRYMDRSVVIGRGFNYATAFELALKLKELTYTIVESYSSADFRHGPMAMIEPGFPVVVVAPSGVMAPQMREFVTALNARHAEVLAISDDTAVLDAARIPLSLPQPVAEWLSPLTAIVPGQLFALHLAHARDFDVDAPRGLSKVTETE